MRRAPAHCLQRQKRIRCPSLTSRLATNPNLTAMAAIHRPSAAKAPRLVTSVFNLAEGISAPKSRHPLPPAVAPARAESESGSVPPSRARTARPKLALTREERADLAAARSAPRSDIDKLFGAIRESATGAITALDAAMALHCTANMAQVKLQHLAASGTLLRTAVRGGEWDLPRYEIPAHAGLCPSGPSNPRAIRQRLAMGAREFSSTLGVSLETLLRWERQPSTISSAGVALLRLINAMPQSALGILKDASPGPRLAGRARSDQTQADA